MKLSKPFVNLTKSKLTGNYTLNSVVSLPKDYALTAIEQGPIKTDEGKVWAVTASYITNGSTETDIVEFAVPLKHGPIKEINKVRMYVKDVSPKSASSLRHTEDNGTDVDYDDAETTNP
ncbi:hypothetical protein BZG02_19175 [Labilibaculum filiforme]|uniref:Uncharacterized protein n=1 Tax=Labilibaculum filiforme TaxID=1940526 RepID=A0A2N3HQZ5_9BACT|nr:hypothetical protein [Labilibaculum filiforme]PKQ60476.1 hypothetical protein BZG02_19175 [Labilibaculum filiforme]